jgi:hypothetical protein
MKTPLVNTLTTRIEICRENLTRSATGSPIPVEEVLLSCRANQTEIGSSEEEDGKIRALFTTIFIIRYNADFIKGKASAMYVKDKDNLKYNIVSVVEKQPKMYLQINTIRRE